MSQNVPVAFAQKFRRDFIMLSQQKGSRLIRTVRTDPDSMGIDGKAAYFERIGATEVVENLTRHGDTPQIDTPHSRRRITLRDFDWADLIDRKDAQKMLASGVLPDKYKTNAMWAFGRKKDDLIIAAANGNAYSIDEDDASSTVALPSAQKIAASAAGLTLAKLLSAKEIIDGSDVDEDEARYCLVTAKQVSDLLNTTEVKSSDYNTVKALAEGRINTFLGFEFIRTERLTVDGSSDRLCLAYTQSALGIATGLSGDEGEEDIYCEIERRSDKRYSMQVYLAMAMDATRIEDEKLVQIACVES
jgi:hypothetical protein